MIHTEIIIVNEIQLVKTYSDAGVKIHGGFPETDYDVAIDPIDSGRTYTETDIPIEDDATAEELLNILTGGDAE